MAGQKKISLNTLLAVCLAAGALAGCSSVANGPLALSDSGSGVSAALVPSILPERRPSARNPFADDRDMTLRGRFSGTPAPNVLALAAQEEANAQPNFIDDTNDPFEPLNRGFHQINRGVDFVLMRPLTMVYNRVLPRPMRGAIKNGLRHISLPAHVVNYALQGEGQQAGNTLARMLVNSIAGFGGLADPASKRDELAYRPTDFGITLGKWGLGEGTYFEMPLLGPSTARASVGKIVDVVLSPLTYLAFASDFGTINTLDAVGMGVRTLEVVEMRARNADLVDQILYASPDTYITLRTVYLQSRRSKLRIDEITSENLPEILEFSVSAR